MFSSYYMSLMGHVGPNKMHETDVPVVVISPEDREQVERLWALYCDSRDLNQIDGMQTALREFANPTPPKPDEPTGLGAVVEDAENQRWVRTAVGETLPWVRVGWSARQGWRDIDAVRVLSEGVTP